MKSDFPQNERAKMEAKLTALLLGELHAADVASLSQAMEADPELAALYRRIPMRPSSSSARPAPIRSLVARKATSSSPAPGNRQ